VNPAIQQDRRGTEKPFLLNHHSQLVWVPRFNAGGINMALQQISTSEGGVLI
jgi:hypothetical protein